MAAAHMPAMSLTKGILRVVPLPPLLLLILAISTLNVAPAVGADGIAISGSFGSQQFVIPQGGSVSGPSINVLVYNTSSTQFNVMMITEAVSSDNIPEPGITVSLTQTDFPVAAHDYQEVQVGLAVGAAVSPGPYRVSVTAQRYTNETGIVPGFAAGLSTDLTVTGDSAFVSVETVGVSGQPVVTTVRLWRLGGADARYEIAYSYDGVLQQKMVAPGRYVASAYSTRTGELLKTPDGSNAEQQVDVIKGDNRKITLTVNTVYIDGPALNPFYNTKTKKLGWVQVVYTVVNNQDPLDDATVRLVVTLDGEPLEEAGVWGPETLPLGRTGSPYNFIPASGWRSGVYGFKLQLYAGQQLYAQTNEQTLDVVVKAAKSSLWIIFVILGVVGVAGLGFLIFFLVKRRKKEEEEPRKAEKKRKEEKPAPKAKEPVAKPEPYRPPAPVQPMPPPPVEEPVIEPAPLASISTLKARMASLGRDQGAGRPAKEEPEADKEDRRIETSTEDSTFDLVPPPPKKEPEKPAVTKAQKPPASEKEAGQKPSIYSSVTATPKQEPPKPPSEVQINWPPKPVELPKPPSDVQINWPPKPVEPPKPPPAAPEEPAPAAEAAPAKEAAVEEPAEPPVLPSRSSFAEAARLRMEARKRAAGTGTGEPPTEGEGGESGGDEERPPSQ